MNILRFLREQAKDYHCSVCGMNHARSEIRVIGKLDKAWLVRVTCSKCETTFKLLVYVDEQRAIASPVKEEPASRRRPAVTSDDVIDAHDFLDSFDGDMGALFKRRGRVGSDSDAS